MCSCLDREKRLESPEELRFNGLLSIGPINASLNGFLISRTKYHHSANVTFSVDITSEHSSKIDDFMKSRPLLFTSNPSDEVDLVAECYVLNILPNGVSERLEGVVTIGEVEKSNLTVSSTDFRKLRTVLKKKIKEFSTEHQWNKEVREEIYSKLCELQYQPIVPRALSLLKRYKVGGADL